MTIKVIVTTHKEYRMPEDDMYVPLHVGKAGSEGFGYIGDDTGENISDKNLSFCELTGLYWAWKNLTCDYFGLVHYRRHFTTKSRFSRKIKGNFQSILTTFEAAKLLEKNDLILPRKRYYYIETLYSHYKHTHYAEQLDETRNIIREFYPAYLADFDEVLNRRSGYMFNMYIMPKKLSNRYSEWLFPILFALEERIDMPYLSTFQNRFYGRVSEILFNVWLSHEQRATPLRIAEVCVMHMEAVNWYKKDLAFLKAKFFHKKYSSSF